MEKVNIVTENGIICKALPGQTIESFAKALLEVKNRTKKTVVGSFNTVLLIVHSTGTETKEDIINKYYEKLI